MAPQYKPRDPEAVQNILDHGHSYPANALAEEAGNLVADLQSTSGDSGTELDIPHGWPHSETVRRAAALGARVAVAALIQGEGLTADGEMIDRAMINAYNLLALETLETKVSED